MRNIIALLFLFFGCVQTIFGQTTPIIKHLHYSPTHGKGFRCENPKQKFNRALYGSNTAFRVETGDFPEFAMYLPGMGGNCKIGLINEGKSKWISEAKNIETIYEDGAMFYQIKDDLLGSAILKLKVTATYSTEGMLIDYQAIGNIPKNLKIIFLYGGITGKKFNRDGDIGADPESVFYLTPEKCLNNQFQLNKNQFKVQYNPKDSTQIMAGIFPKNYELAIANAVNVNLPQNIISTKEHTATPCLIASGTLKNTSQFCYIQKGNLAFEYEKISTFAQENDVLRQQILNTIQINTPDSLLNPLGQALSLAADAIWENPTYMHGAIAWRMRLPAWRGPYIADVLGQHDRAKTHFSAYAKSQVGSNVPLTDFLPDTAMNMARQVEKIGKAIFTDGYICRNPNGDIKAHHYDMNLVYIDQLLNHFNWTGDTTYLREIFPVIEKHLAWEKHNFDPDNDGLFDAYCCIWASDALQYSGGGVTHSTAYNYRAFRSAAQLAKILGKNDKPFQDEANKIYKVLQEKLWLNETGCFAEYKDALGLQQTHPSAAVWTVYHAIDSEAASSEQQFSMTKYIDKNIPKIPFSIPELKQDFYLLSTTNWQPYTWSINNVALGENLHTALACWQGGNPTLAYNIWRNNIIESFYTSASPGGFEQLSSLDAMRGELYRDFADGIGMAGRSLIEGLFGIKPHLLAGKLTIEQGFPKTWDFASLKTKDISFDFKRNKQKSIYNIKTGFNQAIELSMFIPCEYSTVKSVNVNGKKVESHLLKKGDLTFLSFTTTKGKDFKIEIIYGEEKIREESKNIVEKVSESKIERKLYSNIFHTIDLSKTFNEKVTNIFKNEYLSPRPQSATLQLPTQGIGNWCYPLTDAIIDDSGLRKNAQEENEQIFFDKIPFRTPSDAQKNNIAFVSKWDNFPDTLSIKTESLTGQRLHLLMAGTTNPMQSQMNNGKVVITFENDSKQEFHLNNPNNWWPIEQDFFYDGKAFKYSQTERPTRLLLKTGKFTKEDIKYNSIKGFSNKAIDGGAANVYEINIPKTPIKAIQMIALNNDVIIGLMAVTVEE
ncbi:uncharacterized protein DUF608 [Arcicella aurantiaca]|uniref:Uncharacterized protein DUF608 n=1 Tax=Arcicella aurantiaca TaxID=591202 RepID=A0A316F0R9_9BACT|nr:DUF4450 domain-containing protein [Arcicella aurantiaca]PWK29199.1 uncharacterized protein DUF608 [Arcicella aurantiaca]